jgi:ATP-dependent Clp protease ATP-binding subunit ClpB
VKRVIQKYVLNELSKELLGGKINKDRSITIDSNGAGLVFKN